MCDRLVDLLDSVLCTFVYFVTSGSIDKAYRKRNGLIKTRVNLFVDEFVWRKQQISTRSISDIWEAFITFILFDSSITVSWSDYSYDFLYSYFFYYYIFFDIFIE